MKIVFSLAVCITSLYLFIYESCCAGHNDKAYLSISLYEDVQGISHMQLYATRLLTAFPLDGDTAEAPCRSALTTYRILLLPQVRPLGAAHLREEGVEVGRFPLAAAPVFHPAEAGKTLSRWEFGNHRTPLGKQRPTGRAAGGNTRISRQNSLLGRTSISRTEAIIVFFKQG